MHTTKTHTVWHKHTLNIDAQQLHWINCIMGVNNLYRSFNNDYIGQTEKKWTVQHKQPFSRRTTILLQAAHEQFDLLKIKWYYSGNYVKLLSVAHAQSAKLWIIPVIFGELRVERIEHNFVYEWVSKKGCERWKMTSPHIIIDAIRFDISNNTCTSSRLNYCLLFCVEHVNRVKQITIGGCAGSGWDWYCIQYHSYNTKNKLFSNKLAIQYIECCNYTGGYMHELILHCIRFLSTSQYSRNRWKQAPTHLKSIHYSYTFAVTVS